MTLYKRLSPGRADDRNESVINWEAQLKSICSFWATGTAKLVAVRHRDTVTRRLALSDFSPPLRKVN